MRPQAKQRALLMNMLVFATAMALFYTLHWLSFGWAVVLTVPWMVAWLSGTKRVFGRRRR